MVVINCLSVELSDKLGFCFSHGEGGRGGERGWEERDLVLCVCVCEDTRVCVLACVRACVCEGAGDGGQSSLCAW